MIIMINNDNSNTNTRHQESSGQLDADELGQLQVYSNYSIVIMLYYTI